MNEAPYELEQNTLDFVASIEGIDDPSVISEKFHAFLAAYGFSTVCCMKVPDYGETLADNILISTTPAQWSERYIQKDYVFRDPMVLEMFRTYRPYAWSDVLERRELDKEDVTIVHEASEFQMNEGFVIPLYSAQGYSGMVSVTGEQPILTKKVRSAIQLAAIYVHNRLVALWRRRGIEELKLTPREKECLCWSAIGKSDWDIGVILSISEKTVNFHMENAKRKFGVATRIQAVVQAIRAGYLSQI